MHVNVIDDSTIVPLGLTVLGYDVIVSFSIHCVYAVHHVYYTIIFIVCLCIYVHMHSSNVLFCLSCTCFLLYMC